MRFAVAVCFHRRPAFLSRVLEVIRSQRPPVLFGISDGPAADPAVVESRRLFLETGKSGIPVECVFADKNLGLRERMESGLDHVFARVPFAVVLEEDCLPEPDFFPFVEACEAKWRGYASVGGISGNCFHPNPAGTPQGYFFSHYPHIWGWGAWAAQWRALRANQSSFPMARTAWPSSWPSLSSREKKYWLDIFRRVRTGHLSTWDYPMLESSWNLGLQWITPSRNLVWNIGFGPGGTNTRDAGVDPGYRSGGAWQPLVHPSAPDADPRRDREIFDHHYWPMRGKRSFVQKFRDRWIRPFVR